MIQQYSRLRVADNTGARVIQCIRIMGRSQKTTAEVGDVIIASVKQAIPNAAVKKGDVVELRPGSRKNATIQANLDTAQGRGIPNWLSLEAANFRGAVTGLPRRDDITMPIQESLIVELYSK